MPATAASAPTIPAATVPPTAAPDPAIPTSAVPLRTKLADSAWFWPLVFGIAGLLVWEFILWAANPDSFVLPRPSEILAVLWENDRGTDHTIFRSVFTAARATGFIIVSSFAVGAILGALTALLAARFRAASEVITPLAVAINAMPIVATAPIFNNWLGLTSPRSNQAVVVLIVFFPVFINTVRGLNTADPNQLELLRSLAAKPWSIIRRVRLPSALPFFFTALKLASSLCVVAAIVVEYFGGNQDALGQQIIRYAGFTQYDAAWATVLAGTLIGVALYVLVSLAERLATPWAR